MEEISNIPLSNSLPSDKLIWTGTSNGLFTVQSTYKLAMESYGNFCCASSSNDNLCYFWKKLWRLPAPHKVRHFLWHTCRDILPTKVNLKRRKVLSEDLCEKCMLELETSSHLFWSCSRAKRVWSCTRLLNPNYAVQFNSFMELAWKMIMVDHCDHSVVALMGTIAWRMWGDINEIRNGDKRLGELELCHDASLWLLQFQEANEATAATIPVQSEFLAASTFLAASLKLVV